jgi:hypothetical protein
MSIRKLFYSTTQTRHRLSGSLSVRHYAAGIATCYGLNNSGVRVDSLQGQEFSLIHVIQTDCGVHPAACPMNAGHLPATNDEVKNTQSPDPLPHTIS